MINESIDLTDQFIQNADDLDKIEKASLNKTTDALDKELLEDLDC
jgi:hypothetical protein